MFQNKDKYAEKLKQLCRRAAADGAVLLKNEEDILPIQQTDNVALFGRCQIDYYKSGTGSGGSVHVEYTTNLLDSLRSYSWIHINPSVAKVYENWVKEHPADNGDGTFGSEPRNQKEMPLSEELVKEAAAVSNKAFVVIGRTAGEEQDNEDVLGSYRLTDDEKAMFLLVTKYFTDVAVILNVANIIDMSFTFHPHVKAVLYTWQGGIEGGNGAADILAGEVTPSGHLTDTIAASVEDYPSFANYGGETYNLYQEDIYLGYRYFETFCPEKVLYPFGFGLSYTKFLIKTLKAEVTGQGAECVAEFDFEITNVGNYAGKEVVQVYLEAPQGKLGKPVRVLAGFEKTALLKPGESGTVTLRIPLKEFASYDDGGITGNKSCYVLEAGDYRFHVGEDCRNTEEILLNGKALLYLEDLVVTERLHEAAAPIRDFERMKPAGSKDGGYEISYEPVPVRTIDIEKRILNNLPGQLPAPRQGVSTFQEVKAGKVSLEDFVSALSLEDLAVLVLGEGMCNARVTSGTAAAFGGVCDELAAKGIPAACASDGPSGIRRDTGEKATQLPIGTMLACSFDRELMEELFYFEGQEILDHEIDTLLGPGMNIHRHPLNGRNFEYYSEDPYLTGVMAAACIKGLHRAGVTGTIKHFACNNQETNRHTVESVVSERALREIYLKGFEKAVKEGGARSLMTTYNPMNGYQNANNYDLNTVILREEWGYSGIVMTDWWARLNHVIDGGEANWWDVASMVRAQNDIYMTVNNNGAVIDHKNEVIRTAIANGSLTLGELQRSALNILRFLLAAPASEREVKAELPLDVAPIAEKDVSAEDGKTAVEVGKIPIDMLQEGNSILFRVNKTGLYSLRVEYMSLARGRDQLLSQLWLNEETAVNVQTRGTMGNHHVQRAAKLNLAEGFYRLSIRHLRPGIQLFFAEFVEE
ncbi:MAG: glycoside hydrolase family 3 protein [Lachnospiraceae bacterium]|nr:glycoside hydrolase family 3 protein [Lachnospiraceae bacterium]